MMLLVLMLLATDAAAAAAAASPRAIHRSVAHEFSASPVMTY